MNNEKVLAELAAGQPLLLGAEMRPTCAVAVQVTGVERKMAAAAADASLLR